MSFRVDSSAYSHIPHAVICKVENLKISKRKADLKVYGPLESEILSRMDSIRDRWFSSPEVTGFSMLYPAEQAGIKLFNNVLERKQFPKYNNVVLAYLLASVEYLTPIGAHDASRLSDQTTFLIKKATGNESIIPSFETAAVTIPANDFTYGSVSSSGEFTPYAWLGVRDVDSANHQIKETTTQAIFTVIGHQHTSLEHNLEIARKIATNIQMSSPESIISFHHCIST